MRTSTTSPKRVPTRFDRQTRFKLQPRFTPAQTAETHRTFQQLKTQLLEPVLRFVSDPELSRQLTLAANEAAAVAWTTPFPMLVLPALLEEKAAEVRHYARRQEEVQLETAQLGETVIVA